MSCEKRILFQSQKVILLNADWLSPFRFKHILVILIQEGVAKQGIRTVGVLETLWRYFMLFNSSRGYWLCGLTFKSDSGFRTSQSVPRSYTKYLKPFCLFTHWVVMRIKHIKVCAWHRGRTIILAVTSICWVSTCWVAWYNHLQKKLPYSDADKHIKHWVPNYIWSTLYIRTHKVLIVSFPAFYKPNLFWVGFLWFLYDFFLK